MTIAGESPNGKWGEDSHDNFVSKEKYERIQAVLDECPSCEAAPKPEEPWVKFVHPYDVIYYGQEKAIERAKERMVKEESKWPKTTPLTR